MGISDPGVAGASTEAYDIDMSEKELLHTLVDRLPKADLRAALRYIEYLVERGDAVGRALSGAKLDDEPLSTEELADLEEALADLSSGATVGHEVARKRLLGS